jgi:hypothetical protein
MNDDRDNINPAAYRFADAAMEVIAIVDQGIDALAWLAENTDLEMLRRVVLNFSETVELRIARLVFLDSLRLYTEARIAAIGTGGESDSRHEPTVRASDATQATDRLG